ncbi:MAG: beta-lactamase family protein [Amphiplicatus sp.]|nr:beta-lactamase family protein [Amphiplicatus sp.]
MSNWSAKAFRPLKFLILLCAITGCATAASPPMPEETSSLAKRFQAELDAAYEEYGFPGATAAYILPDGQTGSAAAGYADVEAKIPMRTESRMLAASIGKSIVAATVLALAQEEKLHLDDPISTWLGDEPWFKRLPNHDEITLRQLLLHTSGLPDHVYMAKYSDEFSREWSNAGNPSPPSSVIEFILDQPALFRPGEDWAYSDTGYLLIGLIIEKASDYTFYEEAVQRFLVPLRMGLTTPSDLPIIPGLAAGYLPAKNNFNIPPKTTIAPGIMAWNPAREWTGGGFASNPRDLAVWAKALYEGRAIKGDYLKDLFTSAPVGGEDSGVRYGAGVGIYEKTPLGPSYGHGGGIPGYTSSMRYYPEYGVAIAFQLNTDEGISDGTRPIDHYYNELQLRLAKVVTDSLGK